MLQEGLMEDRSHLYINSTRYAIDVKQEQNVPAIYMINVANL